MTGASLDLLEVLVFQESLVKQDQMAKKVHKETRDLVEYLESLEQMGCQVLKEKGAIKGQKVTKETREQMVTKVSKGNQGMQDNLVPMVSLVCRENQVYQVIKDPKEIKVTKVIMECQENRERRDREVNKESQV